MYLKHYLLTVGVVIFLVVAYWLISPLWRVIEKDDALPETSQTITTSVIAQALFKPKEHEVTGRAILLQAGDTSILRFEDFETVNGPDLRIYLSADLEARDYIDLGPIQATKGSVNYDLLADIDFTKYNKVLVWCRAFNVLFSYAEL